MSIPARGQQVKFLLDENGTKNYSKNEGVYVEYLERRDIHIIATDPARQYGEQSDMLLEHEFDGLFMIFVDENDPRWQTAPWEWEW
jgi:hypothetical protein